MEHPDEGQIHAWLDDALPEADAQAVAEHVASCDACAAAVAEARGLIAASSRIISALDAVPGGVIPREVPTASNVSSIHSRETRTSRSLRAWWNRPGLAAAALLFVTVGSVIVRDAAMRNDTSDAVADTASAASNQLQTAGSDAAAPQESRASTSIGSRESDSSRSEVNSQTAFRIADELALRARALGTVSKGAVTTRDGANRVGASPDISRRDGPARERSMSATITQSVAMSPPRPTSPVVAAGAARDSSSALTGRVPMTVGVAGGTAQRAVAVAEARVEAARTDSQRSMKSEVRTVDSIAANVAVRRLAEPRPADRIAASAATSLPVAAAAPPAQGSTASARVDRGAAPLEESVRSLVGCYRLEQGSGMNARRARGVAGGLRITDSLSDAAGATRWFSARSAQSTANGAALSWTPLDAAQLRLRVIARGDTTMLRVRILPQRPIGDKRAASAAAASAPSPDALRGADAAATRITCPL